MGSTTSGCTGVSPVCDGDEEGEGGGDPDGRADSDPPALLDLSGGSEPPAAFRAVDAAAGPAASTWRAGARSESLTR